MIAGSLADDSGGRALDVIEEGRGERQIRGVSPFGVGTAQIQLLLCDQFNLEDSRPQFSRHK